MTFAYAFIAWTNVAGTNLVGVDPVETNLAGTDSESGVSAHPQLLPQPAPAAVSRAYPSRSAIANAYAKLSRALHTAENVPSAMADYVALLDSRFSLGFQPGTFTKFASAVEEVPGASAVPSNGDQVAHTGALPPQQLRSRPTRTAALHDDAGTSRAAVDAPAEKPSIFERLFGRPFAPTLAYAAAEDGMLTGAGALSGRYDRSTAVYDISAHAVYMPDGTTLEAHSGLGGFLDDPNHAHERMRGVTPPAVYDLKLRESSFHGVQALRLIPVDEEKVFGRSGLLAHSFMLGPNGQSNGCVSFRNYEAFLQAYLKHEIRRLVVVARLD